MKRCSIVLQAIRERHTTTLMDAGGALAGPLRRLAGRVGADLSRKASASCLAESRAFCMCMPQARLRATFAPRSFGYVLSLKLFSCGSVRPWRKIPPIACTPWRKILPIACDARIEIYRIRHRVCRISLTSRHETSSNRRAIRNSLIRSN